jgi:hypothetical protein
LLILCKYIKIEHGFEQEISKMKTIRNVVSLLVFCVLVWVLFSCATTFIVFDETVAEDHAAYLVVPYHYTVTSFDGKEVEWQGSWITYSSAYIKIPPGEHEITYKYHRDESGGWSAPTPGVRGNQRVFTQTYSPYQEGADFEKTEKYNFDSHEPGFYYTFDISEKGVKIVHRRTIAEWAQ